MNEIEKKIIDFVEEYWDIENEVFEKINPFIKKLALFQASLNGDDLDGPDNLTMDTMNKISAAMLLASSMSDILYLLFDLDAIKARNGLKKTDELMDQFIHKAPKTLENFEHAIRVIEARRESKDEN